MTFYKNKKLFIDKISANQIIKKFGTPAYCYSYDQLKENIDSINIDLSEEILKKIEEIHSDDPNPCV